jgi:ABC-type multidrug transport system permease subunit
MGVTWRFAPGSELTVVWKNSILNQDKVIPNDYFMNLKNMFDQPQMNSISFKAIYYFDYQSLRRR